MIAQKRQVRVTLDVTCYNDLDLEDMDWKRLLELEGDEDVHVSIKEYDPFWYCDGSDSVTRPIDFWYNKNHLMDQTFWSLVATQ